VDLHGFACGYASDEEEWTFDSYKQNCGKNISSGNIFTASAKKKKLV
jgi:hypothetical protein